MGHVSMYWEVGGWLSPSVDTDSDGVDATAERGKDLYIPSPRGGDGEDMNAVDRNLRRPLPKQCCIIYCNKANYGTVSDGEADSGGGGF